MKALKEHLATQKEVDKTTSSVKEAFTKTPITDDKEQASVSEIVDRETSIASSESAAGAACSSDAKQETPAVRPKEPGQEASNAEANLLTFSRQKLALLQCEYNPKCCSHCEGSGTEKELKTCSKCKTAKYCSRECQVQDWETKHKIQCKEIRRLKEIIQGEEIRGLPVERVTFGKMLKASRFGKPWALNNQIVYTRITICNDKLVLIGESPRGPQTVDVYSMQGKMEARCRLDDGEKGWSLCTVDRDGKQYIGISTFDTLMQSDRLEVWTYPFQPRLLLSGSRKYLGVCVEDPGMINEIYWFDGKFYGTSDKEKMIKEFDWLFSPEAQMGPVWSPKEALKLPTGANVVIGLSVIKHEEEKAFVLLQKNTKGSGILRCLDTRGNQVWKMATSMSLIMKITESFYSVKI